jgi:transcription termination/antitermination protein NusG
MPSTSSFLFGSHLPDKAEWYVIRVVAGTEDAVRKAIMHRRESFNMSDTILDVFVPLYEATSINSDGKKITRKRNIFPGYILVQMRVTNESWYIVRNTENVTGFLGSGNVPVPVGGEELDRLKGVLIEKKQEYELDFQVGEFVTINTGPFSGSEGPISEINLEK